MSVSQSINSEVVHFLFILEVVVVIYSVENFSSLEQKHSRYTLNIEGLLSVRVLLVSFPLLPCHGCSQDSARVPNIFDQLVDIGLGLHCH